MNNKFLHKIECLQKTRRLAFSLVELLVAMALIIFMLSIMSQAFVIATTAMSGLKNMTDMIDKVRPVMATLEKDLNANHFTGTRGIKRLSDADFWQEGPPREGYFMIWQDKPNSNHYPANGALPPSIVNNPVTGPVYQEGISNNVGYALANSDANHMLAFTVMAEQSNVAKPDDYFALNVNYSGSNADFPLTNLRNSLSASPPFAPPASPSYLGEDFANFYFPIGGPSPFIANTNRNLNFANQNVSLRGAGGRRRLEQIFCDWMEVAYFIRPTGRTTEGGVPLCTLYRQNKFILPRAALLNEQTYYLRDANFLNALPYMHNISLFTSNVPAGSFTLPTSGGLNFAHGTWPVKFNTPATVTMPWRRMGVSQRNPDPTLRGLRETNHAGVLDNTDGQDFFVPYHVQSASHPAAYTDVFLDNVISFEVKLQVDNILDYRSLWEVAGYYNPNYPNPPVVPYDPNTSLLQSYPGPQSASNPNLGFTKPVSALPSPTFNNVRSDPFWRREWAGGNLSFDRVVFDTWTNAERSSNPDTWVSQTVSGAVLEQAGSNLIYPKPSVGVGVIPPPYSVEYDAGRAINVTGQDITGFPFPNSGSHPFYSRITDRDSLNDLLSRHSTGPTNWQPTPGRRDQSTIPVFNNSFATFTPGGGGGGPVNLYFPKGPRIYSIQVSIRLYDEKSKTAKEFKLIARL